LTRIPKEVAESIKSNYLSCENANKELREECAELPVIIDLLNFVDSCLYFSENPPSFPANQQGYSNYVANQQNHEVGNIMNEDKNYLEKTKKFINSLINRRVNMEHELETIILQITNDSTNLQRITKSLKDYKTYYDNLKEIHQRYIKEKTNRKLEMSDYSD
tara:strand:- start:131 stop:616 length:486 start_codon:yes stop_codon:yes gene_type:complete